jgi:hypothetical protein
MPESIFKDLDPETRKLLLGLESWGTSII